MKDKTWPELELAARLEAATKVLLDESIAYAITEWYRACGWNDYQEHTNPDAYNDLERTLVSYQESARDKLTAANGFEGHRLLQNVLDIIYTEAALQALEAQAKDD